MSLSESLAGGSNFWGLFKVWVTRGSMDIHFCWAMLNASTQNTGYVSLRNGRFFGGVTVTAGRVAIKDG